MKKNIFLLGLVFLFSASITCADWIQDVQNKLEDELEPLVGDMGSVISSGLYSHSSKLGFPGIAAGLKINVTPISDDNKVIPGDYLMAPWITARLGLPKGISVFARGFSYAIADSDSKLTFVGGGAKYPLLKEKTFSPAPEISVLVAYNRLQTSDISINTLSFGCIVGKKLPFLTPFAGISYDMTTSEIKTAVTTLKPSKNGLRFGGGLEIKPLPFLFLNGEVSYAQKNLGGSIGLGIKLSLP